MAINIARRKFIAALGGTAFAWPFAAHAQQVDLVRRIGALTLFARGDLEGQANAAAFVQGLGALDWHEGSNLLIDWRWAGGVPALFERYALELVALGPDVLFAVGTPTVEALRRQTSTIPIVFVQVNDPVGQGFVASLTHPGGNITGFSIYDAPLAGKWLGMLTQITPPVARVAVLYNPAVAPEPDLTLRAVEEAARSLTVAVQAAPCRDDAEVTAIMAELARQEGGGLLVLPDSFTVVHRGAIVALAAQHRLPAVYAYRIIPAAGGLMSYGVDLKDQFRRTATYVDRILRGAKPADLPIQAPTKFELAINLKTAKALGLTVAPSLLATADEVIE